MSEVWADQLAKAGRVGRYHVAAGTGTNIQSPKVRVETWSKLAYLTKIVLQ